MARASDYDFFDPNVGMYRLSAKGLADALQVLFRRFYEGCATSDGKVSAGYTIFGHDGPVTESVLKTAPVPVQEDRPRAPIVLKPVTRPAAAAVATTPRPQRQSTGGSVSDRMRAAREMFDRK